MLLRPLELVCERNGDEIRLVYSKEHLEDKSAETHTDRQQRPEA